MSLLVRVLTQRRGSPTLSTRNGLKQNLLLPGTGGWSTYKAVPLSVTLKPGRTNRIEIKCTGANQYDFD